MESPKVAARTEGIKGIGEEEKKELKGVRYASVGGGSRLGACPDVPRGQRGAANEGPGEAGSLGRIRDIRGTTIRGKKVGSRPWVGRIASNSQKFMAGASTYEREVLLPGSTGLGL